MLRMLLIIVIESYRLFLNCKYLLKIKGHFSVAVHPFGRIEQMKFILKLEMNE